MSTEFKVISGWLPVYISFSEGMLDEASKFNRLLEDFLGPAGDDLSALEVIDARRCL
jgi:hypothetical protein